MADQETPQAAPSDTTSEEVQSRTGLPANDTPDGPGIPPGAPGDGGEPPRSIVPIAIEDEMRRSYLDYSMSVIVGRALPDARDGLKPVHRRVLFTMDELGNHYNKPFKKSARTVGDVMGKYHPHGDAAIYDTLVRMAQDFSMRCPLVDGQGNFGSVDGDSAAAMRYTEARLTRLSGELLADLDKDTVDMAPNYDESLLEPTVLPAKFPNLLVNGSEGIAVGMATKIPPHNLGETIDATIHLIDHPDAGVDDLMRFLPGPDFPTGAFICGSQGIRDAYATGRGHLKVRSKYEIETDKKTGRETIVITEIPYQVNKARLVASIAQLHKDKVVEGITALRDESNRLGMRIVIEVSHNVMAKAVLNNLFSHTDLQTTYGVIMLAVDNGQPRILNLKEILERFIGHRRDVVTRRTKFELRKAEARRHIVEGLLVAQDFIDHVIALIRASKDPAEANWGLQRILSDELYERESFRDLPRIDLANARERMAALLSRLNAEEPLCSELTYDYEGRGFSAEQAKAILEMRLQRLTGLEREALISELLELLRSIAWYRKILGDEATLLDVIKGELVDVRTRYSDPRRTQIVGEVGRFSMEDLVSEEQVVVTLSHAGYAKRTRVAEYRAQKRGGRGRTGAKTKEDDFVEQLFIASTHDQMLSFTTLGRVYWFKVLEIPEALPASKGKAIVNLIKFRPDEKPAAILKLEEGFQEGKYVLFVTENGTVKRTALEEYSRPRNGGINALGIDEGDRLIAALLTDKDSDVLLSTQNGMAIRFNVRDVRPTGRTAYGVRGITLESGDRVVSAEVIVPGETLLTITENGFGKRTPESAYRCQNRGGKGIIDIKAGGRNGSVVGVIQVTDADEFVLVTDGGMLIRTRAGDVSIVNRNTLGVTIFKMDKGDKVASIAKLSEESIKALGGGGDAEDDGGEASNEAEAEGCNDGEGNEETAAEEPPAPSVE